MYNTKFILSGGQDIYPGYLDNDRRKELKDSYGTKREYMRCGCKPNDDLYYRISEDLKIYPEHNNYVHDNSCCRFKNTSGQIERQTAYLINEEDGEVTAFLTFDPKNFSMSEVIQKDQDNDVPEESIDENVEELTIGKDENETQTAEKKEPKLSLDDLIRSINVDAFTEKILNNKVIDSKDTFSKFVYHRMKKIKISKMKRTLGELSLEKDGVRFFYLPVSEICQGNENNMQQCYIKTFGPDSKIYSNFIFPKTLEKALKEYSKRYGIEPDENTMVAGFQYLKKGKGKSNYRILGRVHLFQVSDIGIYSRNNVEQEVFSSLYTITKENSEIRFWIPPDDLSIGAIIEVKEFTKKILVLFRSKKDERVSYDASLYTPLVVDENTTITKDIIYSIIQES